MGGAGAGKRLRIGVSFLMLVVGIVSFRMVHFGCVCLCMRVRAGAPSGRLGPSRDR